MAELTREEKIKIFEKLPKELQNLMESEDTGAFLLRLGEKYSLDLDDDKISLLSKLVGDIILGITPITSLAQEINSKITTDSQIAMSLAQELYNDLLSPVMSSAKPLPTSTQTPMPIPNMPSPQPVAPIIKPQLPVTSYQIPPADRYRESTSGAPEIVDLRRTPPPPIQMPVTAAPIPPLPKPISPLTFTKPIEPPVVSKVEPIKPPLQTPVPTNLIEAEPHKIVPPPTPLQPSQISPRETLEDKQQFIIRPPGLAPTDLPHDVLDLRKDKGEF